MPYSNKSELPSKVREHIPDHAQDIYFKALNNVLKQYPDDNTSSREEVAHKVAWSAIKSAGYCKGADGYWHKK